nr:hypothetical protein [Desulfobulbaceae bacterium]
MKIVPPPPQESSRSAVKSTLKATSFTPNQSSGIVSISPSSVQVGDLVKGLVVSVDADGKLTIESSVGRFTVKSLAGLVVGDRLLLEIVKAGDNPLLTIVSAKAQQSKMNQSAAAVLDQVGIESGELVKGKVVSVDAKGLVTIEPERSRLGPKTPATISVGDKIIVKTVLTVNPSSVSDPLPTSSQVHQRNQSANVVVSTQSDAQPGDPLQGKVVAVDSRGQVIIESAAGRFSAKPPAAVAVGETIVFEIVKAGEKPVVEIIPDKLVQVNSKQSAGAPVGSSQAEMQAAGLVKGTVVSVDSQGQVTIEAEGGRFSAKSFTALSVGDQILVEIVKVGAALPLDPVQGNPAQGKGQVFDILRVLMPWLRPGNAANFQGLLENFQVPSRDNAGGAGAPLKTTSEGQLLEFLVKNSVAEKPDPLQHIKVASLISSLRSGSSLSAGLQNFLNITNVGILDEASNPELKKMAQLLESHGALNSREGQVASPSQSAQLFDGWLFPCFFANGEGVGEWLFSFEQNKTGDPEEGCCLTFYLLCGSRKP